MGGRLCTWRRTGGFTLLELLVAMAIFAIVGALAMGGLNAVLRQEEVARRQLDRLNQVQRAVRIMTSDFSQLNPRYVRDSLGITEPPLRAPCDFQTLVCFSHDGWRNPFGLFTRGTLQRTQYQLEDDKLIRLYWPVMDRTLVTEPRSEVLLDNVESVSIAFPGESPDSDWSTDWPPLNAQGAAPVLPVAVRITLKLKDWGEIVRLVEFLR